MQEGGRIVQTNVSKGSLELRISDLRPSDMSNYTCRARNVAGYHELNGTVTVQCMYASLPPFATFKLGFSSRDLSLTLDLTFRISYVKSWINNKSPLEKPDLNAFIIFL